MKRLFVNNKLNCEIEAYLMNFCDDEWGRERERRFFFLIEFEMVRLSDLKWLEVIQSDPKRLRNSLKRLNMTLSDLK